MNEIYVNLIFCDAREVVYHVGLLRGLQMLFSFACVLLFETFSCYYA